MAKEVLNRGTNPNDGSGDSIRLAAQKLNNNFDELYTALGDGSILLNDDIDFGNNKVFYSNTVETYSDLSNISVSTYMGLIVHVHDEGALYYAHAGGWHKLLLDTSEATPPNYSSPLSASAYSGSWDDLEDKPTIATTILDLGISDGLAGQFLKTDGFGNFSFVSPQPGSYNDLTDKPVLFSGSYNDLTDKPDLSVYQLSATAFDGDYFSLTGRPNIPGDISELEDTQNLLAGFSGDYTDLINTPDLSIYAVSTGLAPVATSGSYNDLTNQPTIPTIPTVVSAFTNDAGYLTSETDSQTLNLVGTDLSISNGNTVDLSAIVGDTVGNFTFASSIIDTDDSSAITVTPAMTLSSDLVVENNLTVNNKFTVNGDIVTEGSGAPELFSESDILLTATDRVKVTQSPFRLALFTNAQRDALTAENGDMIYNTDNNRFEAYVNNAWVIIDHSPIV